MLRELGLRQTRVGDWVGVAYTKLGIWMDAFLSSICSFHAHRIYRGMVFGESDFVENFEIIHVLFLLFCVKVFC